MEQIDHLAALAEKAEPIIRGYWPAVGGDAEQNYIARAEGGVSSRSLPLTKAQVDYLYELNEWFRANLSALRIRPLQASHDPVMVRRIVEIVVQLEYAHWVRNGSAIRKEDAALVLLDVERLLAAGQERGATRTKGPCPLCGRTDNHTHISGPFGMT